MSEFVAYANSSNPGSTLKRYYAILLHGLGPQGWWPAKTRLEVILGAILTQNTSWHNAALALRRLRQAGLLTMAKLRDTSQTELESVIRPAGFFRQKAAAIRSFLDWLTAAHGGSLQSMFARAPAALRAELLALRGLGPETVDTILLYAGRRPYFVADTYTRRILARHGLIPEEADYSATQGFLGTHLPPDPAMFNEFHALLVEAGKRYCKRREPRCEECPLRDLLPREEGDAPRSAWQPHRVPVRLA